MEKLTNKKSINMLMNLCMLLYMVSYITRINYGAVISEIVSAEGISESLASLAVTGSSITYGVGQLISGFLGDRIQPKRLIIIGLVTTALSNLLIPLCNSPYQMMAVWCVNGFAQSFMWPPIVKILTTKLSNNDYRVASVRVSWGSSVGTVLVYVLAPLCITFLNWRAAFYISAASAVLMVIVWARKCPDVQLVPQTKTESTGKVPWSITLFAIMIAIMAQGALRDGVTTWMPSYIGDTFNLGTTVSILTGVVLPFFSIGVYQVTLPLYRRFVKNELTLAAIMLGVGGISALALSFFGNVNPVLSVTLTALLVGAMHGANLMLICMVPGRFVGFGCVSFISGLFNSCTYVGSAISTYGIAVYQQRFGWNSTAFLWSIIAFVGVAVGVFFSKKWSDFVKNAPEVE